MNNEIPCRDCEGRSIKCHTDCDKYLSWKEKYQERATMRYEAKAKENIIVGRICEQQSKKKYKKNGLHFKKDMI